MTTSPNGVIGTWNPVSINTAENGTYIFTPAPGQCAPLLTLTVTINNSTFAVEQGCNNDQYIVTILPENPDGDYTYTWTNTSGSHVGNNSAAFNVTDYVTGLSNPQLPMEFTVTVSNNGCSQSEIITVTQFLCVVPKGISPNGDGVNDSFDLSGLNVHKLKIFNRYGTEVYHFSGNYTNQWKGECKEGTILPSGTYYYLIETNDNQAKTGWVYLNK
ncbi:gliding motility-associated C-terminal domain-containing protein [Flavobacterium kingsejongi]|uniref:Ig-like domain-containing protein n=1 Tax=Flavobacterium kingsejongi TaxID=1678728 RepID=A0A2S1LLR7_9FLAO|nr:gliding motility-associated C-terminal domain-containing protein [Flavobacterium kingsejongi]AWG24710.1 hypothetical protein FK004_05420 [Flavobacterium kingsejongi]